MEEMEEMIGKEEEKEEEEEEKQGGHVLVRIEYS